MGECCVDLQMYVEVLYCLGLDKLLYQQYLDYVGNLVQGNFGELLIICEGVWYEFFILFLVILELFLVVMFFVGIFGLLVGVIVVLKCGLLFDYGVMMVFFVGYLMLIFWWGLILIMLFFVLLGWMLVFGCFDLFYDIELKIGFMLIDILFFDEQGLFFDVVCYLILLVIVLGIILLVVIVCMICLVMFEVLCEDYVCIVCVKGLLLVWVVFVYVLCNVLILVLMVFGLQVGMLFVGVVLIEIIFFWLGIGKWLIDVISCCDYLVVQNGILLVVILVILVNFVVDIFYGLVNLCICY